MTTTAYRVTLTPRTRGGGARELALEAETAEHARRIAEAIAPGSVAVLVTERYRVRTTTPKEA